MPPGALSGAGGEARSAVRDQARARRAGTAAAAVVAVAVVAFAAGCAATSSGAPAVPATGATAAAPVGRRVGAAVTPGPVELPPLRWQLRLDDAGVLEQRVCPAADVAPIDDRARAFVVGDRTVDGCRVIALDLGAAADALRARAAADRVSPSLVLASPDVWLWTTRPLRGGVVTVAADSRPIRLPFPPLPPSSSGAAAWRVDPATWRFLSLGAFGDVDERTVVAAGARLRVLTLPGELTMVRADVDRWLGAAAAAVATAHGGRFPFADVLVVVDPVVGGGVPFGTVVRGGGPTASLLLGASARVEDVVGEWVAVHELAHLLAPPFALDDSWASEGLASYWQEALRARARLLDEADAWQQLADGFARGAAAAQGWTSVPLAEASRRMRSEGRWLQVYWGGAALALLMDLRLRACADVSLDDVVAGLRRAQPDVDVRRIPAAELVERVAGLTRAGTAPGRTPEDRCAFVADDVAAGLRAPFPAVAPLLESLGLSAAGVVVDEHAPRAAIRRAIVRDVVGAPPG